MRVSPSSSMGGRNPRSLEVQRCSGVYVDTGAPSSVATSYRHCLKAMVGVGEVSACSRGHSPRTMDAFAPSGLIRGRRAAFISVGALCQGSENGVMEVSYLQSSSESYFPSGAVRRSGQATEVSGSVRKRRSEADVSASGNSACPGGTQSALPDPEACRTWRLNSSLRSHRTSEAQCSVVSSGLDKTLFASPGPNSLGRGHRFAEPGRIKARRGHRMDAASCQPRLAWIDAVSVPPNVSRVLDPKFNDSCGLLSQALLPTVPFGQAGPVGVPFVMGRSTELVNRSVADHGHEYTQKPTGHGHVGLGLAGVLDEPLANGLLVGVGTAQGQSGFAQGPAQGGVAGLGDVSGLGASRRFLVIRSQARPELDGVGIGEAGEVADLRGDDAGPNLVDTGNTLEQVHQSCEPRLAVGGDDISSQGLPLAVQETHDVQEVGEGLALHLLEQMPLAEQPLLGRDAIELGTGDVGRQKHRAHGVLGPGEGSRKAVPVAAELAQLRHVFIGDPAEGTVSVGQTHRRVPSVVVVVLPPLAAEAGEFRGVGNFHTCDARPETVDEPLGKSDGFDHQMARLGLGTYPLFDTPHTLGVAA